MLSYYLKVLDNESDRMRFEKIYYAHRKQMVTVALSILENSEDAEDAVHDVFCTIAEKHVYLLERITNEQDIKNYLLKATKNKAINMKRNEKHHSSLDEDGDFLNGIDELSDSSFLDVICDKMSYGELLDAIKSLDKKYEEVLYLHFVLEMPASDVAELLGRNLHTVKKQLVRGKKQLTEKLTVNGGATKNDVKE